MFYKKRKKKIESVDLPIKVEKKKTVKMNCWQTLDLMLTNDDSVGNLLSNTRDDSKQSMYKKEKLKLRSKAMIFLIK